MPSHFETYVNNMSRLRKAKAIDRYGIEFLRRRLRRSPAAPYQSGEGLRRPAAAAPMLERGAETRATDDAEGMGDTGQKRE